MPCTGTTLLATALSFALATAKTLAVEQDANLLLLAKERFTNNIPFSLAEQKLFTAVEKGEAAICTTEFDHGDLTYASSVCGTDRVIRADRLAWLCTDPVASKHINYRGISIVGARIDGNLDLDWANLNFPFMTSNCVFDGNLKQTFCSMKASKAWKESRSRGQTSAGILIVPMEYFWGKQVRR